MLSVCEEGKRGRGKERKREEEKKEGCRGEGEAVYTEEKGKDM